MSLLLYRGSYKQTNLHSLSLPFRCVFCVYWVFWCTRVLFCVWIWVCDCTFMYVCFICLLIRYGRIWVALSYYYINYLLISCMSGYLLCYFLVCCLVGWFVCFCFCFRLLFVLFCFVIVVIGFPIPFYTLLSNSSACAILSYWFVDVFQSSSAAQKQPSKTWTLAVWGVEDLKWNSSTRSWCVFSKTKQKAKQNTNET